MFYVQAVVVVVVGLVGKEGDVKRIYLDRTRPGTHMHTKIPRKDVLRASPAGRIRAS